MTHPEHMPSPDKTANPITLAEIAEQQAELDNIDMRLRRQSISYATLGEIAAIESLLTRHVDERSED